MMIASSPSKPLRVPFGRKPDGRPPLRAAAGCRAGRESVQTRDADGSARALRCRGRQMGERPSGFAQFEVGQDGKLGVLRLTADDGQRYEFRRG